MWPQTVNLAAVLLLLTGCVSAFTTVLPTSGYTITTNESVLSKFICGANLENCFGEQLSTYVYVKDAKIYKTEVYDIKLPATLNDIVNEQKKLLTGMEVLENKIQEQDIIIRDELETVERNLIEKMSDISTSVKQEAELLKSNLTRDTRNHKASILRTLTSKLTRLEKKIDTPTDADTNPGYPSSCADAFERDLNAESGIYTLHLPNSTYANPFKVYCLDDPEGGAAWTVVQRRTDGSDDFSYYWDDYEAGFGDVKNEFFIGLRKLHALTNDQPNELWIQMEDFDGEKRFAKYSEFAVGGKSENYALNELDGFSGDAGDSMAHQKGQQFSTVDRNNRSSISYGCPVMYPGAWWLTSCRDSNINGHYWGVKYPHSSKGQGVIWQTWDGHQYSLKYVHMAIRPKVSTF